MRILIASVLLFLCIVGMLFGVADKNPMSSIYFAMGAGFSLANLIDTIIDKLKYS